MKVTIKSEHENTVRLGQCHQCAKAALDEFGTEETDSLDLNPITNELDPLPHVFLDCIILGSDATCHQVFINAASYKKFDSLSLCMYLLKLPVVSSVSSVSCKV